MSIAADLKTAEMTELYAVSLHGDREAFAEIVRRQQNMVTAVTFSMTGNLQQSEDLAQETFVAAWQNLRELREPAKLPAWLCGIARNLSRKWLRKTEAERKARCDTPIDEIPETIAEETDREEQAALLWTTIQSISEKYREPLIMYYRQEQSVPEIAAALELSEDNVRQRIARGRTFLKEEVQRRVESALEQLKPNPTFTVTVMAALPAASLLGTSSALAGTTTATGGGMAGKGLGLVGVGFFTWLVGTIWIVLVSVIVPLASIFGSFNVIVTQTRNSPTVRSRRLLIRDGMIRVGIAMFLMGGYFFTVSLPNSVLSFWGKGCVIVVLAWLFFCNIIIGALHGNTNWRRIIEEDIGRRPAPELPIEKSWLSLRTLRWTFGVSLSMFCLGLAGFMFFVWNLSLGLPSSLFRNAFFYGFFLFQILPIGLFVYVYRRTIIMATEKGLEQYPPTIPNILDIVLGKAEMPEDRKTLRSRIGGDMLGMGCLIFSGSVQPVVLGLMQPNPWPGYLVIAVSVIGFVLFACLIAGKPKVRHLGWMLTCFFFTGFYAWILWGGTFQEQFGAMPPAELGVLFIYVLFFFAGLAGFCGFIGLFEKEVNRSLGILERDDNVAEK